MKAREEPVSGQRRWGAAEEARGGEGAPCDHGTILLIEVTNQTETA